MLKKVIFLSAVIVMGTASLNACSDDGRNSSKRGSYVPAKYDDPETSNDERNDQPLGYFGSETVTACTPHNERCYTLDALFEDNTIQKVYFQKGGRLSFKDNSCLRDEVCNVHDQNGRLWNITRATN